MCSELGWQLDLAAELEEYLESIDHIEETTLVNFAEAALLVQKSSLIYSKKVENLYTLVLEALSQFQTTTKSSNTTSPSHHPKKKQRLNHHHPAGALLNARVCKKSQTQEGEPSCLSSSCFLALHQIAHVISECITL